MNDIIKIKKSLEDSNTLTNGITESVKTWTKKGEDGFLQLTSLAVSLLKTVISSVVKGISERGVRRAER